MAIEYGEYLRIQRLRAGYSLRAFAKRIEMKPSNLSFIESGKANPPRTEKTLFRIAAALNLKRNSAEWDKYFNLSSKKTEIPVDIAKNDNIRQCLPIMLRTIASARLTKRELEELIVTIKKSGRKKQS
jgi:transcriptional regulator with XRE-family HTH domain